MNVNYMFSLLSVILLFMLAYAGVEAMELDALFGIYIPYLAVLIFVLGLIRKVLAWAAVPVPFRIPTTCGQQKSLPWIKPACIDNPSNQAGVWVRMALEILCFRSLFRNIEFSVKPGSKFAYRWEIWLWAAALAFHWAFFAVIVRHLRFVTEPVPCFVKIVEFFDGLFRVEFFSPIIKVGLPGIYMSGLVLLGAVLFLLIRRILMPQIKYISLAADFFPLFLITGIALSGIFMRYFTKVDIVGIKAFAMGLVTLNPTLPERVDGIFYVHIFFVSVLLIYFPFSKLMHLGGIFFSPTRNQPNNTRVKRYVNPWNYPVPVHSYEEYEDDFREKMVEAGLPVEKQLKMKEKES